MSDFALHAIQSSQAPRDVELQQSLDTRGFDATAFPRLTGEHLVTHSVVPRVVAHENWAVADGTAEGIAASRLVNHHHTLLQKMQFSPYVGFQAVHPVAHDVGMGVQFPGMAAAKPDPPKQPASAGSSKEKEASDSSVNIQTVRTQTLAAHNLNSKEPTENDRIRKIEEWRNNVAKATLIPQLDDNNTKPSQTRQRRRTSRDKDYSSDQKESLDVISGGKGTSSQLNAKDGKKEGKTAASGKRGKGKGKAGIDREDSLDTLAEAVKPELKSDDKQMEMKREKDHVRYQYDWPLTQPHSQTLFNSLYPMPFNPTVLRHMPFGLGPGRIPSQSDLPVCFPPPGVSITPAFPHFAALDYKVPSLHKMEQMPTSIKAGGSAAKDRSSVLMSDRVHHERPVSTESSKKEPTSTTVCGAHGISELTEASSRSTLVPGQRHYKLVKGTAPSCSSGGKVKAGEGKQRVGKGRRSKVKEQKSTANDNLSVNVRPSSSPVLGVVTASVAQVTSVVIGSTANTMEHGHDRLTHPGLVRGRKTKLSSKAEKSPEKRMKTDKVSEQDDGEKDECAAERLPPGPFSMPLRESSYMYGSAGALHPLPDERLMAHTPFALSATTQAAMYGQLTVKQDSILVPSFPRMDRPHYHSGMFKHSEVSSIPPSTVASKVKDESIGTNVQADQTESVSRPVVKQLGTPKRPNTLSFVSEEIRNLPGGKILETQTPEEIEARAREFDRHEALRNLASPVKPRHPGLVPTELPSPRLSNLVPSEVISPSRNSGTTTDGKKVDVTSLQSEHSAFSAKSVKKRGPVMRSDSQTGKGHVKVPAESVSRASESGHVVSGKAGLSNLQQEKDKEKDRRHGDDSQAYRFHQLYASSSGSLSISTASTALSSPTKLQKKNKQQNETVTATKLPSTENMSPVKSKKNSMDTNTSDLMQRFKKLGVGQIKGSGGCTSMQPVSTAGIDVHSTTISSSKDTRQMSPMVLPVSQVSPNLVVTAAQSMLQDVARNSGVPPHGGPWSLAQFPYGAHHHHAHSQSQYHEWLKQRQQQRLELERRQSDKRVQPRKDELKQPYEKKSVQQRLPVHAPFSESATTNVHAGTSEIPVRGIEAVVTSSSSSSALPIVTDKERMSEKIKISSLDRKPIHVDWQQQQASNQDLQASHSEQSSVVKSARPGGTLTKRDTQSQSVEQKWLSGFDKPEKTNVQEMQGNGEAQMEKLKTMESTHVHISTDIQVMNVGQSGEGLLKASPQEKHDLEKQLLREHGLDMNMSRWQQSNGQRTNESNSEVPMSFPSLTPKSEMYSNCRVLSTEKKLISKSLPNENSNHVDEKLTYDSIMSKLNKEQSSSHSSPLVGELCSNSLPTLQMSKMHRQKSYEGHNWIEQRKLERSDAESSGDDMEDTLHLAELRACSVLSYSHADPMDDEIKEKSLSNGVMEYELYELEDLGHPVSGRRVQSMLTGFNYYSLMQPFLASGTSAIDQAISCGLYRQYKTDDSRRIFGDGKSVDLSMDMTNMSKQEVKVRVSLAELQQQYKGHLSVLTKLQKKARRHARKMKLTLPKDEEQKIPTSRKRGRPRKQKVSPVKTHGGSSDSQSEGEGPSIAFPIVAPQDVPVVKKRGRGRPPKDPNAVRKPLAKKNITKVEKTYNMPGVQKASSFTSDDEAREQFAHVEQAIDLKRCQGTRGMASVNTIAKKQEDSDADFSASIHSDSTYDAEEEKVAVKSAKAGWQRRRQRAAKKTDASDLEALVAPLRKSFQLKGRTASEDGAIKEHRSSHGQHLDCLNEVSTAELSIDMAATSGLDALSRCATMALAITCQGSNFDSCETAVEPVTQPKKRGRKSKAMLQDGNGVNGGAVAVVSENVASDSSTTRQSEQPAVISDTVASTGISTSDTLVDNLNGKKQETNNSKHKVSTVQSRAYNKDLSSDKARFRKYTGKKSVGEVVVSAPSRKAGKASQRDLSDIAGGEGVQTRKPPAKRACLVSQEKNKMESSLMEPATSGNVDCRFTANTTNRKTAGVQLKANFDKQNINSNFHLSSAVLVMDQRVLIRDLEEPRVYSFATIVNPKPPDLYGVIVEGDRRRKVHWLSQEEIIEKGVLNVKPTQECGLPRGCRVCARWSVHQKCYYPGRVLDDVDWTTGQCFVEFDDGDQAWKPLEMVRRIMDSDTEKASDRSVSPTEDMKVNEERTVDVQCSECCENVGSSGQSADSHTKNSKDDRSTQNDVWHSYLTWQSVTHTDSHPAHYSPISENCESKGLEQSGVNSKEIHDKNMKNSLGDSPTSSSLQSSSFAGFDVAYSDISSVASSNMDIESELVNGDNLDDSSHILGSRRVDVVLPTPPLSGDLPRRCAELEGCDNDEWEWCGKGKMNNKRRRGKKTYFKSVSHGDCILSEGDSAIFKSRSRRGDPYIGLIEKLYEACGGTKMARVKWFYRGTDVKLQKSVPQDKAGIYLSLSHVDNIPLHAVVKKCQVLSQSEFSKLKPQPNPQKDCIYYKKGVYDQMTGCVDPAHA